MPNTEALIGLALIWALATPASAGVDEPFPLSISSVTPSFRADSLGPEFLVSFVNNGSEPIRAAALAKTVFIEQGYRLHDAAALECVSNWVFQPALKAGRPVSTVASAPVTFKILDKKK